MGEMRLQVGFRVPRVDADGQAHPYRDLELRVEGATLHLAWSEFAVEVQSDLAIATTPTAIVSASSSVEN